MLVDWVRQEVVHGDGLPPMDENTSVSIKESFQDLPNLIIPAHGCYGGTPLLEITKEGKIVKRGFL